MDEDHHIWQIWAHTVHRWGLGEVISSLLEAFGPLTFFSSQTLYIFQPFIELAIPENHLNKIADLLENPEQTKAFIAYLRNGKSP